jgi:ribonuclease D
MKPPTPDLPETIVTTPEELAECCAHLAACPQLGFDTEFVGEETYIPRLCLVQVATAERLYLIDPFTAGPLDAFWRLLLDPDRTVVVHAGREEIRLCQLWTGRTPANLFDLQIAAGLIGLSYPIGHGPLVNQVLRIRLGKGETLTEWRERPLTRSQIQYAFDDVRYLLPIWSHLHQRLEELERLDWAREEFARLTVNAVASPEVTEKWRKLRGLGSLDPRKLAIVREIFTWREQRAAEVNRPARTVVRDDLIVEIAKRNPSRERDLQVIRGLPKRDLDAIMQAVQRARALSGSQLPEAPERDQDPPQVPLVLGVLNACLGDWCARMQLAPNLVASNSDLRALVRSRLTGETPDDTLLLGGWRGRHVLPELEAILDGRRWLRIAAVKREAPLEFEERE